MFSQFNRSFLASLAACALCVSISIIASAQAKKPPSKAEPEQQSGDKDKKGGLGSLNPFGKGKDKEKEEAKGGSANAEQAQKPTKQEREYQKIKQFSEDLYAKDAAFREEVEETYRQKQREHSEYAFFINTRDAQDEQVTRTGDRLKVEDTLYDNPLVQDYVNRVGQSVVPPGSPKLYAFKVTLNPIPEARSLSTGTVYISSGLLSLVDNEAQLAYVLGHEIAHIERDHWHQDALVQLGMERYNEKQQQKRAVIGGIASIGLGAMTGGLGGGFGKAALVSLYAQLALPSLLKMAIPNAVVSWDKAQEDEADQLGLQYMLNRRYDPREVPKFYANLIRTTRDQRAGGGFMADAARIVERVQQVNDLIGGFSGSLTTNLYVGAVMLKTQQQTEQIMASAQATLQAYAQKTPDTGKAINALRDAAARAAATAKTLNNEEIKQQLAAGELIGSSAEFNAVMAELKRDNGVRAYYYDMFQMARDNLEESLQIRSNDPFAHYYYGKALKLTARTPQEKQRALFEFVKAIELDRRRVLAEPHLYRALALIDAKDPAQTRDVVAGLKAYVDIYQRMNGGQLPPNMDVIYDYLQEAGEMTWAAPPLLNVKSAPDVSVPLTVPASVSATGSRKQ